MRSVEEIRRRVIELAAEQVGMPPEEVTPEHSFRNDLGFDSLDDVEFGMAVEDEFEIAVPDEVLAKISIVADAINLVAQHAKEHEEPAASASP